MTCSTCGNENRGGRKFCSNCGTPLSAPCPRCGATNESDDRFCGECGAALVGSTTASTRHEPPRPAPVSERKLVSVLFADLVGFTTLSENRDPEEVRELLSRYFETARTLIARYGGTVEKFIGDAVMAVWGTPITQEDDAERAVRAGLELVDAVAAMGAEVGAPDLSARAGVATGETAVTIGAEGQGLVAGDLVNTASRVQAAAEPGTVSVTEATRHMTEAAIAYEDARLHELKGKAERVALSRAIRVIALRGGELRSTGLESPFVGRDRELRTMKDLLHRCWDEGRAHLLSVTGIGGIGKSRLSWEFLKYIDGLIDSVWWHRGRCLSYGDGVTYWALSEMVRTRAGIAEEEAPASAAAKLRACVEEFIADPEERGWVEPRLAHLLGIEERTFSSRDELFAGWRLFFERIADRGPVVMVFEDLQWADDALLDFVDYLVEWAREHPLFVVTLARPELTERRSDWGVGKRRFTSLYLEPLSDDAIDELLQGMVPGLPDELRARIRDRAEGVPLYAVETVRMLLDRGLLVRAGDRFEPTEAIEQLDVPESLQGLIASRLDGLPPDERTLLQVGAVLGKTFTRNAIAALSGSPDERLDDVLGSLVRKELLSIQNDPRATDHGQYGFLQSLVQKIAYDTLSKKDRKERHLAVAENIERTWAGDEDEVVEVLASHYVEAYELAPDAADAVAIRSKARETLTRAGRRAQSLAAPRAARGYFLRAAELANANLERAELKELAGIMADISGSTNEAIVDLEEAEDLFRAEGRTHDAARVSARIGDAMWDKSMLDEALARMTPALEILKDDEPDADLAVLAAQLGRIHFFAGHLEQAAEAVDLALVVAESLWLPETISEAMNTKGLIASARSRPEESHALIKRSLEIALENDAPSAAIRAYFNLANEMFERDRYDDASELDLAGLALSRRLGWSAPEWFSKMHIVSHQWLRGAWDEALATMREAPSPEEEPAVRSGIEGIAWSAIQIAIQRGDVDEADRFFDVWDRYDDTVDVQIRSVYRSVQALVATAHGDHRRALELAREAFDLRDLLSPRHGAIKSAYPAAVEAALALGDVGSAESLVSTVETWKPGVISPFMRAETERFRARLSSDAPETEGRFKSAAGLFREIGTPFYLACTLLEHGEWLIANDRTGDADPLLREAREIFERLEATPWLQRLAMSAPDRVRT
ncbi:MAG: adenylate/guanylate cyclase domain-containing protein [Actinomycetota bacterium]